MEKQTFAEDSLILLGPGIASQTSETFFTHVQSLYEPRTSTGKAALNLPKGKILKKPTKDLGEKTKRPCGSFEIRYQTALGLVTEVFEFPRDMVLSDALIEGLVEKLRCAKPLLEEFLEKKKFTLAKTEAAK